MPLVVATFVDESREVAEERREGAYSGNKNDNQVSIRSIQCAPETPRCKTHRRTVEDTSMTLS